jgi:hypothetical protein
VSGAIAGALGNLSSQGLSYLAGLRDDFSWSELGEATLEGGLTAGASNYTSKIGSTVARIAVQEASAIAIHEVSQGVSGQGWDIDYKADLWNLATNFAVREGGNLLGAGSSESGTYAGAAAQTVGNAVNPHSGWAWDPKRDWKTIAAQAIGAFGKVAIDNAVQSAFAPPADDKSKLIGPDGHYRDNLVAKNDDPWWDTGNGILKTSDGKPPRSTQPSGSGDPNPQELLDIVTEYNDGQAASASGSNAATATPAPSPTGTGRIDTRYRDSDTWRKEREYAENQAAEQEDRALARAYHLEVDGIDSDARASFSPDYVAKLRAAQELQTFNEWKKLQDEREVLLQKYKQAERKYYDTAHIVADVYDTNLEFVLNDNYKPNWFERSPPVQFLAQVHDMGQWWNAMHGEADWRSEYARGLQMDLEVNKLNGQLGFSRQAWLSIGTQVVANAAALNPYTAAAFASYSIGGTISHGIENGFTSSELADLGTGLAWGALVTYGASRYTFQGYRPGPLAPRGNPNILSALSKRITDKIPPTSVTRIYGNLRNRIVRGPNTASGGFEGRNIPNYDVSLPRDVETNPATVYGLGPKPGTRFSRGNFTDSTTVAKNRAIREDYLSGTTVLEDTAARMRAAGAGEEAVARELVGVRNAEKVTARQSMNPEEVRQLEEGNMKLYGDPVGPTPEYLYNKLGSWEAVSASALEKNLSLYYLLGLKLPPGYKL